MSRLIPIVLAHEARMPLEKVHDEAQRREHKFTDVQLDELDAALGHPTVRDPHGDPIPSREFQMPDQPRTCLADLRPGERAIVRRINTDDAELLRYLASIGLTIHSKITVLDVSPFDGNIRLQIDGQDAPRILGSRITSKILVAQLNVRTALTQEAN